MKRSRFDSVKNGAQRLAGERCAEARSECMLSLHGPLTACCLILVSGATLVLAQQPFLSSEQWIKLRDEANGAAPYENLRYLTRLHRVPATAEFDQAAKFILQRAREYGLTDVQSEAVSHRRQNQYGLMRSYLGWPSRPVNCGR